jgi:hypothetical protein
VGWTTNLLTGLAEYLDTAGIATWSTTGTYTPDQTGITFRSIPPTPDRLITLADYVVDDFRGLADITIGVQIRIRGLPRQPADCMNLADQVYDALHSLSGVTWAGVPIVDCYRASHTSLGSDGNDRWAYSLNFMVDAMRPTVLNTD